MSGCLSCFREAASCVAGAAVAAVCWCCCLPSCRICILWHALPIAAPQPQPCAAGCGGARGATRSCRRSPTSSQTSSLCAQVRIPCMVQCGGVLLAACHGASCCASRLHSRFFHHRCVDVLMTVGTPACSMPPAIPCASAGFDAHKKDEINFRYIGVTERDYEWLTEQLVAVANRWAAAWLAGAAL